METALWGSFVDMIKGLKKALPSLTMVMLIYFCITAFALSNFAQNSPPITPPKPNASPRPSPTPKILLEGLFIKHVFSDQKAMWTLPFHLKGKDAEAFAAFGAATAGLIAVDRYTSNWVARRGTVSHASRDLSSLGTIFASGGFAAAIYFTGRAKNNWKAKETGVLSTEALIDSGIVVGVLKHATQRPRPNLDGGRGHFFEGGLSFPSGHSASAWSVATVVAYEYKNRPLAHYGAYAAALAVSLARYGSRAHFMSEVLIGSAIGFYTGRYVYRTHHVTINGLNGDDKSPGQVTKIMPKIIPLYDARTSTYGAKAVWSF